MARDVAKCFYCKAMRFEDEVILDKSIWEYVCRDKEACEKSRSNESINQRNRVRYRKKVGLSK